MSTAIPGALAGSYSQKKSERASTSRNVPGTVVLRDANGAFDGIASSVADNAITSAKIANDTIVDADVNASAAIAGTKISPDFGGQNVVTTSGVNGGSVAAGAGSRAVGGNTAQLQSHGTTGARFAATRWTADTNGPILTLAKSRGAAVGTRGVVQSGDTITSMEFYGDDGTSDVLAARILVQVDGNPGTNDMPGRVVFSTTADGASNPTERLRITSAGDVVVGKATANSRLNIAAADNVTTTYPLRVDNSANNYGFGIGAYGMSNRVNALNQSIDYTVDIGDDLIINTNGSERIRVSSAAAALQVNSTTQGFLPPRMTTAQRDAIATPPAGLMVYNSSTNKLNFYNGTAWEAVTSA